MTSDQQTKGAGTTWAAAGIAAPALIACFRFEGLLSSAHSGAFFVWAISSPFFFAIPVGWIADDPGLAGVSLISCSALALFLNVFLSGSGEALGAGFATVVSLAMIIPGLVFGVAVGCIIRTIQTHGLVFHYPRKAGYWFLAALLVPALVVLRYSAIIRHDPGKQSFQPLAVTDDEFKKAQLVVSDNRRKTSARYYLLGVTKFQEKNFNAAIREWKMAIEFDPDNADAHSGLERLGANK